MLPRELQKNLRLRILKPFPQCAIPHETSSPPQIPCPRLQTETPIRSSRSQMLFQTGVLKNFAIFTGKHLCWSLKSAKFFLRIPFLIEHLHWLPLFHVPSNIKFLYLER